MTEPNPLMAMIPANPLEAGGPPLPAIPSEEWGHLLIELLTELGVKIGEYDDRIVAWVAGWDWWTVGTILSWFKAIRDNRPAGRPGEMVQDDDGTIYVHCADGLWRMADADQAPYTFAELDSERGPILPLTIRRAAP